MRRAIALGLLQGPTELAPVSSSAHTALLGRPQADAAFAKSFEVALHGASAAALVLAIGGPLRREWGRCCAGAGDRAARRRAALLALSLVPPTIAGGLLEPAIERRLGGPRSIAAGLALGAIAMARADRRHGARALEDATPADGLALGIAQALALAPGISRRGATLAAARRRGFARREADALSWLLALPVIAGACVLKAIRLARGPRLRSDRRRALLAGAGASFVSTFLSARPALRARLAEAPIAPFCAYRIMLAALILARRASTAESGRQGDGAAASKSAKRGMSDPSEKQYAAAGLGGAAALS